ncbi:MAG: adenylate/guanylate cyclase domain-containing protein [Bacteriovoracia bacterium]
MSLKDEIQKEVKAIFKYSWDVRDGKVIPDDKSLTFKNEGIKINVAVMYADLADSTKIVKTNVPTTAAEIYKSFLYSTCKVIRDNGGEITAFDGDRVMAVFMNDLPNTRAARTALHINYVVKEIVQKEFNIQYPDSKYVFNYGIGIDQSEILVAKTGVRGANDLVWVGNAANIAAKVSAIRNSGFKVLLTESSYKSLQDSSRLSRHNPPRNMWTSLYDKNLDLKLYGSNWTWGI